MLHNQAPAADVQAGFFRLPKVLFLDEQYRGLSPEAKLLYSLMLDRMGLSIRNGWADDTGRVFIYFTLAEIKEALRCEHGKATRTVQELEKAELLERGKSTGRAQRLYVRDFACLYGGAHGENKGTPEGDALTRTEPAPAAQKSLSTAFPQSPQTFQQETGEMVEKSLPMLEADTPDAENRQAECPETVERLETGMQSAENRQAGRSKAPEHPPESGSPDAEIRQAGCPEPAPSNTEKSYTDFNETYLSILMPFPCRNSAPSDAMDRTDVLKTIRENLCYDILLERMPDARGRIDGIVALLADTLCSRRPTLRISGEDVPIADVRERLLSLNDEHVEYVLDCLSEHAGPIGNIRAYLLTALYNAPLTIDSYYDAMVRRDIAQGFDNLEAIQSA